MINVKRTLFHSYTSFLEKYENMKNITFTNLTSHHPSPFLLAGGARRSSPFAPVVVSEISAIVVCAARVECELKKPGGFRPSGESAREPHCHLSGAVVL